MDELLVQLRKGFSRSVSKCEGAGGQRSGDEMSDVHSAAATELAVRDGVRKGQQYDEKVYGGQYEGGIESFVAAD